MLQRFITFLVPLAMCKRKKKLCIVLANGARKMTSCYVAAEAYFEMSDHFFLFNENARVAVETMEVLSVIKLLAWGCSAAVGCVGEPEVNVKKNFVIKRLANFFDAQ